MASSTALRIRAYGPQDLARVAKIHADAFVRQGESREWIAANARAYPRMRLFVAEIEGDACGYILWTEKSGFRKQVVLELEQMAVAAEHRRRGVGAALIAGSLPEVEKQLAARGASLRAVVVTTRADNEAQKLYRKALGARVEATIADLYSADEVLMVARR